MTWMSFQHYVYISSQKSKCMDQFSVGQYKFEPSNSTLLKQPCHHLLLSLHQVTVLTLFLSQSPGIKQWYIYTYIKEPDFFNLVTELLLGHRPQKAEIQICCWIWYGECTNSFWLRLGHLQVTSISDPSTFLIASNTISMSCQYPIPNTGVTRVVRCLCL